MLKLYQAPIAGQPMEKKGIKGPGKLRRLRANPAAPGLLCGEMWVDPQVLSEAGFEQGPRGLVSFALAMGADVCFFPWSEKAGLDGRKFAALAHDAGLDCALIIDGPFQRLASRTNLYPLLVELAGNPLLFTAKLDREIEAILSLLESIKGANIDMILIGEDVGYGAGQYFSLDVFRSHLLPCYEVLLKRFPTADFAWGWHSDGRVERMLPDLLQVGFQFFSLETECVDLLGLKKANPSQMCLIGGIRADWLAAKVSDHEWEAECLKQIQALNLAGGLVVGSTCGIYRPEFLPNLQRIYQLLEKVKI